MRSSIRQVAERANVSPMTVSRVVQGRKNQVSEETYNRVLSAMQELNYIPVRPAVQNRHVATNTIGVVPQHRDPFTNPFDNMTFNGICRAAAQHGYDLFIMLRGEAEWMANREELRFLDRRSDGFIFVSPGYGEWQTSLEALVQNEIPVVVCYRREVPEGVVWVDPDNEAIANLAIDCLVRHGHKEIAYLGGPKPTAADNDLLANLIGARTVYDDEVRAQAFSRRLRALKLSNAANRVQHISDPQWNMSKQEVENLLATGATGIVCINDYLALQLWRIAESMGIKIPGQLSIVGVGNELEAANRGLTSVTFSYDEVGRLALEAWMERQNGSAAEDCCKVVPVHLVERSSVSAPGLRRSLN